MKVCLIITLLVVSLNSKAQSVNFSTAPVQRFDMHLVSQGETLYSLSKRYHITIDALLKLNPDIINNNLQKGKMIKVPIVEHETSQTVQPLNQEKKEPAIIHKVENGETVYSISKRYKTDVVTILMWNDMKEPAIQEGQNLVVGYQLPKKRVIGPMPIEDSPDSMIAANDGAYPEVLRKEDDIEGNNKMLTPLLLKDENPDFAAKTSSLKEMDVQHDEKGIAVWTHTSYDEGYFYALHATAPQGTIITVRNLMNNKIVAVKVIGRLQPTSDNENVLIKLSESAAKKLNVLDEKFLVEINYTAPGEITGGLN